jgi:mono/diheme cytochrome c family protein
MIATTAFVVGFVLLGLGVLLVAMRGGARGTRQALHTQTPRGRMAVASIVAGIAVAFGVGIPAAVLAGNSGAHENNGPGGLQLTAAEIRGRELFAHNCATCHTLRGASASGRVGPNLDQLRPPQALVLNAILLGRARGNGQMPAQLLVGQDARDVATFVAAVAGR